MLVLDGNLEKGAHVLGEMGNFRARAVANIFFFKLGPVSFHSQHLVTILYHYHVKMKNALHWQT